MAIEVIICSAYDVNWAIIVWKRHCNCLGWMRDAGIKPPPYSPDKSGFYTNKFRYVDRKEWMIIAKAAGQLLDRAPTWEKDTLYSEDLR